jgi:hypothetical protein
MKGENKEQRKGLTIRPKNRNPQPWGQEREVEKSHVFDTCFPCHKKHVKKEERRYTKKKHLA